MCNVSQTNHKEVSCWDGSKVRDEYCIKTEGEALHSSLIRSMPVLPSLMGKGLQTGTSYLGISAPNTGRVSPDPGWC